MAVPAEYQSLVDKFRSYLKDSSELNELFEEQENTDDYLYDMLVDSVDEINYKGEPHTEYTLGSFPSWLILRLTATLQYLIGCGIHSARNQYNYSDSSGIQAKDTDTYGRYINIFNVLIAKKEKSIIQFKRRLNIDNCYDVG